MSETSLNRSFNLLDPGTVADEIVNSIQSIFAPPAMQPLTAEQIEQYKDTVPILGAIWPPVYLDSPDLPFPADQSLFDTNIDVVPSSNGGKYILLALVGAGVYYLYKRGL